MAKVQQTKRQLINKANSSMVIAVAVAAFLVVFALISSRTLISQRNYQSRIIDGKTKAVNQLKKNKATVNDLATKYQVFISTPDNVIGGNPNGTGDRDGNNAKIVLDALPSKYDFPAFVTSIEKVLNAKNFTVDSITGKDDEVAQTKPKNSSPVEIPFKVQTTVNGYPRVKELLTTLEQSIRPIKVTTLTISGGKDPSQLSVQVEGVSYYQATKGLTIGKKVVK